MYPDVQGFIDLLKTLDEHPFAPARELFDRDRELIVTRAPGRLDVMGGIADYSGSLVLELPIAEATFAAIQLQPEPQLNFVTLLDDEPHHSSFSMSLRELDPVSYEEARRLFQQDGWAAYVAGVFLVLMRERYSLLFRRRHPDLIASAARQRRQFVSRARSRSDGSRHQGIQHRGWIT